MYQKIKILEWGFYSLFEMKNNAFNQRKDYSKNTILSCSPIDMQDIKKELEQIKERNKRVEMDKARETSTARKISIMILTYMVIVLFFYTAGLSKPWVNAIVPTLWFMLSTLSLPFFKKLRMQRHK